MNASKAFFIGKIVGTGSGTPGLVFNGDVEFWVSPTGDDTGPGTQANPWLTYARCVAEARKYIAFGTGATMIFHLGGPSGTTYVGAHLHDVALELAAYIAFVGDTTDTVLAATPCTAGSSEAVVTGVGCTEAQIVVAGAGWAVDTYRGATCRMLTGSSAGVRATIASNTATMLRLANNSFRFTTGGLTIAPGDTFVIERQGIAVATNELPMFSNMQCPAGRGGVVLCNLRIEGSISNTDGRVQFVGCQANGTRNTSGPNAVTVVGSVFESSTVLNPTTIFSLLGMPTVVGNSLYWFDWGGQGAADDRASGGGQYSSTGCVQYGLYPSADSRMTMGGGLIYGPCLAQGALAVLSIPGGGGQTRVESTGEGVYGGCIQVAQGAVLEINRAAFACAGRCIVVAQNSRALLGMNNNNLITGSPTVVRAALGLFGNENTVLFRTAMLLTGNGTADWEMGGLSGFAVDVLFSINGTDIADPNGNRIGRLGV